MGNRSLFSNIQSLAARGNSVKMDIIPILHFKHQINPPRVLLPACLEHSQQVYDEIATCSMTNHALTMNNWEKEFSLQPSLSCFSTSGVFFPKDIHIQISYDLWVSKMLHGYSPYLESGYSLQDNLYPVQFAMFGIFSNRFFWKVFQSFLNI